MTGIFVAKTDISRLDYYVTEMLLFAQAARILYLKAMGQTLMCVL